MIRNWVKLQQAIGTLCITISFLKLNKSASNYYDCSINHEKKYLHAFLKCAECLNLSTKKKIAQLGIGEKHNEEHDRKPQDVCGTACQCGGQLGHCLIETDVFEYLQEEYHRRIAISFIHFELDSGTKVYYVQFRNSDKVLP